MARYGDLDSQYCDDAGNPLVNGKIYFYETGTTTPKTTYTDVNYTIPNTNPVILTAAGRQPNIFFEGVAKAILTKSDDTQLLVRDPVGDTASTFGNAWIASKDYNANDVVQGSDGNFYVSLTNGNVNNNPITSSGYWTFLYSVEWSAGTTYKLGSVVTYETIVYQSLQNSNLNKNPVTETSYWVPIQLVWNSSTTYSINANVVGTDGILYTSLQNGNIGHTPASSASWWVGTSAAAAASATAAASSATSASTSATNAATSATSASSSASSASTSATNAAASATNASSSASSASTSASSASTSATNALSYLNTFKGQYYGPLSSDPTVDPLGAAMTAGDLYWNTTASQMKVYTGSAWITAYVPVSGYAQSGANSDITSLSGLTTPLSVGQGGTGASTLTGVLKGNGTSAFTASSVNLATEVTGTLPVANGGTGATSLTANNVILGNGTSAVQVVAPGTSGNVLTSNGTTWQSSAPSTAIIGYTSRLTTTSFAGGVLNNCATTAYDMDGDIEIIVGANGSGNVVAVAHKNSTDTFGSPLVVRATNCGVGGTVAIKHTSTQILVVSCTNSSTALEAVVVSLNTGTLALTANTAATATLSANISAFVARNGIVAIPSLPNSFAINYAVSTPTREIRAISISGTTVTIGSATAPTADADLAVIGTGDKIIVAHKSSSNVFTTPYTVSGSTLSAGTGTSTAVSTSTLRKFFALGTRFCLLYSNNTAVTLVGAIVTLTGTTTTISTATLFSASNNYSDCMVVGSDKVFVVSANTTAGQGANILTDSSGTASAGTAISTFNVSYTYRACAYLDGTNVIMQEFSSGTPGLYNIGSFDCSGSSPVINKVFANAINAVNSQFEVSPSLALVRARTNFYGTGYGYAIRNTSIGGAAYVSFETRINPSGLQFYQFVNLNYSAGAVGRNDRENWYSTSNELIKMELLA